MGLRAIQAVAVSVVVGATGVHAADDGGTRLLRQPALSKDRLAFVYGGDLYLANRDGSAPQRLTASPAPEFAPHFSPDGQWLAFSATYDNNTDVYVMPARGGDARRLTFHPAADTVTGWSSDGKRVLFVSSREVGNSRSGQLYEVAVSGGYEKKVMKAVAVEGAWSPDGKRIAYRPTVMAYAGSSGWRQHRGGDTPPVWIIDPAGNTLEKVPHVNASDSNPMWVGEDVAFISDRADGSANLFLYDTKTKSVRQLTHESPWDVKSAQAFEHTLVYEAGGLLKRLDVASGTVTPVPVQLEAQAPAARPQWKDAMKSLSAAHLSPSGKRVLVTARGDVFSVPVKDGSVRNLTASSGVRESDAVWSPDGLRVAYLSDEGGAPSLMVRDAQGLEKPVRHTLGHDAYFTLLGWSPDGRRLVFNDNHLHLYALELASNAVTLIDTSAGRAQGWEVSFSPDGEWLTYSVIAPNNLVHARLHGFADGRTVDLTDPLIQSDHPVFGGADLIYFTASTDAGPTRVSLDMSTQERPLRAGLYAVVLPKDGKSPLPPKPGDEGKPKESTDNTLKDDKEKDKDKAAAKDPKDGKDKSEKPDKPAKRTHVDYDGLTQRLVPIPVAERNYERVELGADGALYYLARYQAGASVEPPGPGHDTNADLYRYNLEEREEKLVRFRIADFSLSADRKKMLLTVADHRLEVADAGEKIEPKPLDTSQVRMLVDPRAEWAQIFDETYRMELQYFYDPKLHGLDWPGIRRRYEPLLKYVQRREDLSDVLIEMIGEMQVGHNRLGGGDVYQPGGPGVGLLGADFTVDNGRYRIERIYRGDAWNPFQVSPLLAAGVDAKEGDVVQAINGHALDGATNLYALLEGTAGKQVALTLSRDGKTHTSTVIPIDNEQALRQWSWVEANRAYVEKQSGGRIAYVYMPDTAGGGYAFFNRMFFAQADKDAVIVDDRRNSGGQAANYVLEVLNRPYLGSWKDRDAKVFHTPAAAIYGPKVMLVDQDAGSGGDFMPYGFRELKLGKLIGTRTWGGLIGISANPPLIDNGFLTVPYFRFFSPQGEWRVENEGVAPDVEVPLDPVAVNAGHDVQLDAALAEVMAQLKRAPPTQPLRTAPPMPTPLGK